MSITNILKTIKQIHPNEIILVKIGEFYHVYGKDAYILSYLLKYKLKFLEREQNIPTCGFPEKVLPRVEATLENKKINYILVDRRNNYDVDEFVDYKNLNEYEKEFEKAYSYMKLKIKLDDIYNYMLKNITKEEVKKIINEIEKKIK